MLPDIGISARMLIDRGHSAQAGAVRKRIFSVSAARQWCTAQMLLDRESSAQAGAVTKGTFSVGAAKHWELSSDAARQRALSSGRSC
jgi:hypothetical protein